MVAQRHVLRCLLGKMVWVGVMLALPLFLFAKNSGPADSPAVSSNNDLDSKAWWKGVTADGFLSLSYTYNMNNPAPRVNQFRVFDFNDDDPQLDLATGYSAAGQRVRAIWFSAESDGRLWRP
jgi:hypothetical protein